MVLTAWTPDAIVDAILRLLASPVMVKLGIGGLVGLAIFALLWRHGWPWQKGGKQ